eukprot:TRINITY_DN1400_c0_g2_i2.p1 TRINITY_DN1400_c0_g2~~TRINITY_DN1400_c0_g2_i2.p1  ORF type:complete len:212 (-),score=40.05 TRINITY_DN1400_c0_g2_i2:234-869(-)
MADNGKGVFGVLMAIFIAIITLGTQTIQLFFNVSFIASSFSQFFPGVMDLDIVLQNIQLSVELIPELNIVIPFQLLLPFGAIVQQVLRLAEVVRILAAAWPCHGGLTVVALALFGFSAKRILGIVAGETMFKMAIKSQSAVNNSNVVLKKLYQAITKLAVFMVVRTGVGVGRREGKEWEGDSQESNLSLSLPLSSTLYRFSCFSSKMLFRK